MPKRKKCETSVSESDYEVQISAPEAISRFEYAIQRATQKLEKNRSA